ncbi:pseudaminic acid cytidylyltransferase [Leptospira terpstrae]|uniref:Pseudaminic acid CMP-transferase n=1 Tax=Leptospira terpstrae serovar Hualin str. LT 11-33 = ATCC 700639 TaxID=1257025 RepID=N1VW17_9LEPT|nr:pseudaminic acid cytidylyltransferase [Leptospira terpstrae]EMY60972.1 pseudaminic acid CMP-transferase [Leptospira terpstrae serovar Hualin str. LT 11-33 = ATCC 700639]
MNSILAIITARGGSKRIPRKNIKDFCGIPIISYPINTALDSKLFQNVMVSTDDLEIKRISENFGAEVPFLRSSKNSDDFATTADVILEVLETYEKQFGRKFEYACCIYPTSPLLKKDLLAKALELLETKNADSVFPIIRYSSPIQRALIENADGFIEMIQPENRQVRSQDLHPAFFDAGQFYFLNVNTFMIKRKLWTERSIGLEISDLEAQDIDNESDWKIAELKYKLLYSK